jgi:hypothetical protein
LIWLAKEGALETRLGSRAANEIIPVLRRAGNAQTEAGPLMPMMRRINMGVPHSSRRLKSQSPLGLKVPRGLFDLAELRE